jgi:hypothetical protein
LLSPISSDARYVREVQGTGEDLLRGKSNVRVPGADKCLHHAPKAVVPAERCERGDRNAVKVDAVEGERPLEAWRLAVLQGDIQHARCVGAAHRKRQIVQLERLLAGGHPGIDAEPSRGERCCRSALVPPNKCCE